MKKVNLKPKAGIRVLDPKTLTPIPSEGKIVILNTYWSRRIKEGSVEVMKERK